MDKDVISRDCPKEFEVRQPRWLLIASCIFLAVFISIVIYAVVEMHAGVYDTEQGFAFILPSSVILFVAILGFYLYANDTFKYANGEFVCKRTLRRTKTWNIDNVSYVKVIRYGNRAINILFWDKNDKKIATVTDGLWVWNDGRLQAVLYFYNIPIKIEDK